MATTNPLPGGPNIIATPIVDPKTGRMDPVWLRWFSVAIPLIEKALQVFGVFEGTIGLAATVQGRTGTVAQALTHVDPVGVVLSPGLVPATDLATGAVQLPAGATSTTLGTAALFNATDFDTAGAAAAAQSAAIATSEAYANAQDATNLAVAKSYTDSKFPGVTAHTITLAKITTGGTDGSISWDADGVITAYVDPT